MSNCTIKAQVKKEDYTQEKFMELAYSIQDWTLNDNNFRETSLSYAVLLSSLMESKRREYQDIQTIGENSIKSLASNEQIKEYVVLILFLLESLHSDFSLLTIYWIDGCDDGGDFCCEHAIERLNELSAPPDFESDELSIGRGYGAHETGCSAFCAVCQRPLLSSISVSDAKDILKGILNIPCPGELNTLHESTPHNLSNAFAQVDDKQLMIDVAKHLYPLTKDFIFEDVELAL